MTKEFTYGCDGGTIMIGNETSRVCFPNGYGDGEFSVEITTENTYGKHKNQKMEWLGVVNGDNLHVYKYDCLTKSELTDDDYILYTLSEGRWAVYALDGNILLEFWGE